MIEQNVQVLRCDSDKVWVRMGARSGCSACDDGKGCGAGLFAKLTQRKPVVIELARNDLMVEAGQMLTLALPERVYIKMVLASYGWPLVTALAGAFGGYELASWLQFTPGTIDAFTLSAGILSAWLGLRVFSNRRFGETFFNSMSVSICIPSNTPNMCTATVKKPEHN